MWWHRTALAFQQSPVPHVSSCVCGFLPFDLPSAHCQLCNILGESGMENYLLSAHRQSACSPNHEI